LQDIESIECIRTYEGHENKVFCVKKFPDNKIISGHENGEINIWDFETGECTKIIDEDNNFIKNILLLSGNRFATNAYSSKIKIFDMNTFNCINSLNVTGFPISAIDQLSNDKLVCCSLDSIFEISIIKIWDLNHDDLNQQFNGLKQIKLNHELIYDLKVISENEIAFTSNMNIKIFNIETRKCLKILQGHSSETLSIIQISREKIASSDRNGEIKIWNLNNCECLKTFKNEEGGCSLTKLSHNSIVSFSFSRISRVIKIWDIETGSCLKTLEGHSDTINSIDIF